MKKNNKMFSIGEIAKSIGITRKIILNYESKGLIKPDHKDGYTGNRYYTIDTFTQIRTIRIFQNLGLSLDEIRDYFNNETDLQPLIKRLEVMRDELNLNIEKLYERTNKNQNKISIITVEPQTVYSRTCISVSVSEKSLMLRDTALEAMRIYGTDTTKRMYFTESSFAEPYNITFSAAIPNGSKGENVYNIARFRAISTYHHGAYEELPKIRDMLVKYANDNNIVIRDKCRHIYLEGPPQHKDPHKFITQVIIPIKDN